MAIPCPVTTYQSFATSDRTRRNFATVWPLGQRVSGAARQRSISTELEDIVVQITETGLTHPRSGLGGSAISERLSGTIHLLRECRRGAKPNAHWAGSINLDAKVGEFEELRDNILLAFFQKPLNGTRQNYRVGNRRGGSRRPRCSLPTVRL